MPQQKQQYEDALGSIFDFIFEESQKPPNKVKPVKVTGVDGTSEYVEALTAVLENPLLFVNNNVMESFKDAVDINLATVRVGNRAPDNIKFNIQDIGQILKDPGSYVDNQFKKLEGIRKQQRAAWAGEAMKGLLGGIWARQRGLDSEAQEAMAAAGRMGHKGKFRDTPIGARTTADTAEMGSGTKYLAEKYLGIGSKGLTKQQFESRYGVKEGENKYKEYIRWRDSYNKASAEGKYEDLSKIYFNRNLYSFLESLDLTDKASEANKAGEKEKAQDYIKASHFVENVFDPHKLEMHQRKQRETLKNYSETIKLLRKSNDPEKKRKIVETKSAMKKISSDLNVSRYQNWAGKLGQVEGMYYSAKNLFVDGNLIPNIINGKFFSDKYNSIPWIQPSKEGESFKYFGKKGQAAEFHAPIKSSNRFKDRYNEGMNSLYYYSPVTWVKSLMTGEVFAYWGYRSRENFKKKILEEIPKFDYEKFLGDILDGKQEYINSGIKGISAKQMKKLESFMKRDKIFSNLAYRFGTIGRWKDSAQKFLDQKIWKAVRDKVGNFLLTKITNGVAVTLIEEWMLRGGVKTLIKGIITSIASAIGLVGTPLASAVIGAITWITTELLYKISKPVIKLGAGVAILFTIGFLGLFVLIFGSFYIMVFGQHSHVAPQQIVKCDAYYGTEPIIDDPDNPGDLIPQGPMEEFVAGALPPGEQCLLGVGSYSCTQGPYGSFSHKNVAAIDLGGVSYFHAPSFCGNGGTCTMTYVGDVNCTAGYAGGLVKFSAEYQGQTYEFKLIHVDTELSNGQSLSSGQRVARVMEFHETGNACSSGKHLHLETKVNGAIVNPYDVMTKPVSEGGFGCGVSACY